MPNMHFYGNFKQNPKFLKFELLPPPNKTKPKTSQHFSLKIWSVC